MADLAAVLARWEPVIGLEVHVQLLTESKIFSASSTRFGAPPNSLTDPPVLGLPGALPVMNRRAVELAIRLGVATGCSIRARSRFARKHYFYPDLPKGYQISQYDEPLCEWGEVVFGDPPRRVRLRRIHLEEDAGKNIHQGAASWVDLNRAGVPLCEVVSEPDLHDAADAAEYLRTLRQLVRYLGISDGNMEEGSLRCDANVSVRPRGEMALGTRAELKNINSFKFVERAIEHEIARQARILEGGGRVVQETRLWDSVAGVSHAMRSKEEANDYRYFPDPDLPPLVVAPAWVEKIRAALPELPAAKRARFVEAFGLSADDARTLCAEPSLAAYFEAAVAAHGDAARGARGVAAWILSELLRELHRAGRDPADSPVTPANLAALVRLIDEGTISGKQAKEVFAEMVASGADPGTIVESRGLRQISDEGELEAVARRIVDANPKQAAAYRAGKTALLGFFVGQLMKETGGKANPALASALLQRVLGS